MADNVRVSDEPTDRLTRLGAEMNKVLEMEENHDVRGIVMLTTEDQGGIAIHGYEDQTEAMAELLSHLQAMFQANGMDISLVTIPETPEGLT
jgi:hypothetical protein